jgi:hypothetical protein
MATLKLAASSLIIAGAVLMTSCQNGSGDKAAGSADSTKKDTVKTDAATTQKKEAIEFKFATAEANLPAPFEVVKDITGYQAAYKPELLNPVASVDFYVTPFKKEVNMGIYGIDLAYVNFYGQNQELLHYFVTIQKLAKELNFDKVFDDFSNRFKTNSGNKDSVVKIVDNVFEQSDAYLKKNDKFLSASHIMAGALIEINYLSLNLLKDTKKTDANAKFFDKVYQENLYIYHLIKLLEEYTDADSKALLASLKTYRKEYDDNIKSAADLTPEKITKVCGMISGIRAGLIKK